MNYKIFLPLLFILYYFLYKKDKSLMDDLADKRKAVKEKALDITDDAKFFLNSKLSVENGAGEIIKTGENSYAFKRRESNEIIKTFTKQDLIDVMPTSIVKVFI